MFIMGLEELCRTVLPKLLPSSKCRVNLSRRVVPQPLGHMTIDVEGHRYRGVAEPLLCDLRMNPCKQKLGGVSVSEFLFGILAGAADGRSSDLAPARCG